jgi:hypothetical protein
VSKIGHAVAIDAVDPLSALASDSPSGNAISNSKPADSGDCNATIAVVNEMADDGVSFFAHRMSTLVVGPNVASFAALTAEMDWRTNPSPAAYLLTVI